MTQILSINDKLLEEYKKRLSTMNKISLLDEFLNFSDERNRQGELTEFLMKKGIILFEKLIDNSETPVFSNFVLAYLNHLKYELEALNGK